MEPRKILAVAGRVRLGSRCLHMFDLLRGLHAAGHKVTLVCTSMPQSLPGGKVSFPVLSWEEFLGRWPALRRASVFRRLCAEAGTQVIHIHGVELPPAARRLVGAFPAPTVFTPYTSTEEVGRIRALRRKTQRVIALTEYMRQGLVARAKIPRSLLRIVPPGLDLGSLPVRPPEGAKRQAVVGVVGPFRPQRGQRVFLHAARKLLDSGRKPQFVLAGDGPLERALRKECETLGITRQVTVVTRLPNYRAAIGGLDVFVSPAGRGGLSYTMLEAMAMGKAVVAAAAGEAPEMIEDGRTGVLAPKDDPDALGEAIGQLLDRPENAREMGLAARRGVEERYGLERLIEETLAVYDEAVAEYKKRRGWA